jgi:hypothetical protein
VFDFDDLALGRGSPMAKEEQIVSRLNSRPIRISIRLSGPGSLSVPQPVGSVWALSLSERRTLIHAWAALLRDDASADMAQYTSEFQKAAKVNKVFNDMMDSEVLKSAAVVGMTTNGAAKYGTLMRTLLPEVVIVEEAAEVLEASIVAALTSNTKHLVLIGDHLQLRSQVSQYNIATHFGLEVSLFERLVKLGMPHVTLSTQRRMHPSISALITPRIYRTLLDAPSVSAYPPVRGVRDRLYFINHTIPEDGEASAFGDGAGPVSTAQKRRALQPAHLLGADNVRTNEHEAQFLTRLLLHLLYNGYKPSQLVVLCMYKGQVMLLRRIAQQSNGRYE